MSPATGEAEGPLDDEIVEVLRRHALTIAATGHSATGASTTGDSDAPLTAASVFRPPPGMTPAQGLGLLAAMLLVLLSGLAGGSAVEALGVRGFSALLLAVAAGAAAGLRGAAGASGVQGASAFGDVAIAPAVRLAFAAVLVGALATGSTVALALLPAVVHAGVAHLIFASLGARRSIVEVGARLSHPLAPAFIVPYCRRLTVVWGLAFGASAVVTALLAVSGRTAAHAAWTGWQFWSLLVAFCVGEFFFRKAWFRYFGKGPFDRFLARLLPPERTERGRRSQAWLLRMRSELARMANEERERAGRSRVSPG